jgi:hypothetical protein
MKKLKEFIKSRKRLTILIVLLVMFVIIDVVVSFTEVRSMKSGLLEGIEVENYDTYMYGLKDVPSDIEGMSQYDKYIMGLDYHDGSDSDHDGLTDKEEIEIYGTDPLKMSTSGDLYTDGYKVANGMDTDNVYEMSDITFEYNECSEVELEADEVSDLMAVVEDVTDRYSLSDYGIGSVYKGYSIYNYSGELSINLNDVFNANNISLDDIEIWTYEGTFLAYGLSEMETCKYVADNGIVTLENNFEQGKSYYIFITEKSGIADKIVATAKKTFGSVKTQINGSKDDEIVFLVEGSPLLWFLPSQVTVYYSKQDTDDADELAREKAYEIFGFDGSLKFVAMETSEINKRYNILKKIFSQGEYIENKEWDWSMLIYVYQYSDAGQIIATSSSANGTSTDDDERVEYNNYHTSFDPYVDELPFQNFETEYAPNGNCTGIAYLTSYLFNNGYFPSSGSYNGIEWKLSDDSDNATLTDKGLYDYKTRTFVDDNSGKYDSYIGGTLTDGETEFIKMIGACWQEGTDNLPYMNDYMISNDWSNDWELAEKMMDYMNQGKILNIGIYLRDGSGHEMTVYDYYFNTAGELIFRVYDCNIPQDKMDEIELNCNGACYLQCKKVLRSDGTYGMEYLYYPIKGLTDYVASSDLNVMSQSVLIVSDENWNVFN